MRLLSASLALSALIFTAQAGTIGFDPAIMAADGGDAFDINVATGGVLITLTNGTSTNPFQGGGIFVFHNVGADIFKFDVNVQFFFNGGMFPAGFFLDPTIVVRPSVVQQTPSFTSSETNNSLCSGGFSESGACLLMEFGLSPGPLFPSNTNFILDFDAKVNGQYVGPDANVASGDCVTNPTDPGCTTDTSNARVGDFPSGGQAGAGVPEPGYGLALLLCAAGLRIYYRRLQRRA